MQITVIYSNIHCLWYDLNSSVTFHFEQFNCKNQISFRCWYLFYYSLRKFVKIIYIVVQKLQFLVHYRTLWWWHTSIVLLYVISLQISLWLEVTDATLFSLLFRYCIIHLHQKIHCCNCFIFRWWKTQFYLNTT